MGYSLNPRTQRQAPQGRYQVIIEVFDHKTEDRICQSTQSVAAVSPIQAIRRAGMKLVQKLTREAEGDIMGGASDDR